MDCTQQIEDLEVVEEFDRNLWTLVEMMHQHLDIDLRWIVMCLGVVLSIVDCSPVSHLVSNCKTVVEIDMRVR